MSSVTFVDLSWQCRNGLGGRRLACRPNRCAGAHAGYSVRHMMEAASKPVQHTTHWRSDTFLRAARSGMSMGPGVVNTPHTGAARGLSCGIWGTGGGDMQQTSSKVLTETDRTGATRANSVPLSPESTTLPREYHSPQRVINGGRPCPDCDHVRYKIDWRRPGVHTQPPPQPA